VITSLASPTLIVEPTSSEMVTSLIFLVAGALVTMKSPPQLLTVSSALLTDALVMASTIMITKSMETSPSGLTRSLGLIEVEKELVMEMVNSFFKSLN